MTDPRNCRHHNIHWDDFFELEKQNNYQYKFTNACCIDCGTDKGRSFAFNCQLWYLKKIGEWFTEKLGLNYLYGSDSLNEFIKKNYPSFEQNWQNLRNGRIDEEYFEGIFGQGLFWEVSRSVELCCLEFAKEKQNNPDKPTDDNQPKTKEQLEQEIKELESKPNLTPYQQKKLARKRKKLTELNKGNNNSPIERERERERERAKLQTEIDNLTNKPHKTKAEEAELDGLKKKLAQLTKPTNNQAPGLSTGAKIGIGVVIISVLVLVIALILKKNTKKK